MGYTCHAESEINVHEGVYLLEFVFGDLRYIIIGVGKIGGKIQIVSE